MPYRQDDARERERSDLATRLATVRDQPRSAERAEREAELLAALRALAIPSRSRGLPALPLLPRLRIASPCREDWNAMVGDERVRRCSRCEKDVFDLSALTSAEAESLLASHRALPEGGTPCVRFYRRSDGTILTTDCVEGTATRRVVQAVAAAALLAGASATASALAPEERPDHITHYPPPPPMVLLSPEPPPAFVPDICSMGGCLNFDDARYEAERFMGASAVSAEDVLFDVLRGAQTRTPETRSEDRPRRRGRRSGRRPTPTED
jgi:hypothetical protein